MHLDWVGELLVLTDWIAEFYFSRSETLHLNRRAPSFMHILFSTSSYWIRFIQAFCVIYFRTHEACYLFQVWYASSPHANSTIFFRLIRFSWYPRMMSRYLAKTVLAIIPLSLWVVGTILIQNPESWFASKVNVDTGFEEIQYANIFFFSWAVLFSNVYLVSAIFVNSSFYNPDLTIWVLLFAVSATLCGSSSTLKSDICALDDVNTCRRTTLGIAIGATVTGLSGISALLTGLDKMLSTVHLLIGFICLALYICGVSKFFGHLFSYYGTRVLSTLPIFMQIMYYTDSSLIYTNLSRLCFNSFYHFCLHLLLPSPVFLTSASGPAVTMGSIYFATWGGAWFSTYAFARGLGEMFGSSLAQAQWEGAGGN